MSTCCEIAKNTSFKNLQNAVHCVICGTMHMFSIIICSHEYLKFDSYVSQRVTTVPCALCVAVASLCGGVQLLILIYF